MVQVQYSQKLCLTYYFPPRKNMPCGVHQARSPPFARSDIPAKGWRLISKHLSAPLCQVIANLGVCTLAKLRQAFSRLDLAGSRYDGQRFDKVRKQAGDKVTNPARLPFRSQGSGRQRPDLRLGSSCHP
jgi:hypothetical protein